jgi:hypothetical protein
MHKMMQLRDNLMDELEKFADKPITEQNLEYIDKLAHAIKCIDTVDAMERSEQESRDGYSGRMYRDGMSGRRGYFYTQRDGGGTSNRRRRDSMGRYADDYSGRYSRDEAKDKLIGEMEGMMGDVSPEAQHAIQKAIHALGQE